MTIQNIHLYFIRWTIKKFQPNFQLFSSQHTVNKLLVFTHPSPSPLNVYVIVHDESSHKYTHESWNSRQQLNGGLQNSWHHLLTILLKWKVELNYLPLANNLKSHGIKLKPNEWKTNIYCFWPDKTFISLTAKPLCMQWRQIDHFRQPFDITELGPDWPCSTSASD